MPLCTPGLRIPRSISPTKSGRGGGRVHNAGHFILSPEQTLVKGAQGRFGPLTSPPLFVLLHALHVVPAQSRPPQNTGLWVPQRRRIAAPPALPPSGGSTTPEGANGGGWGVPWSPVEPTTRARAKRIERTHAQKQERAAVWGVAEDREYRARLPDLRPLLQVKRLEAEKNDLISNSKKILGNMDRNTWDKERLQDEVKTLRAENERLESERHSLSLNLATMKRNSGAFDAQKYDLESQLRQAKTQSASKIESLERQNDALTAELSELSRLSAEKQRWESQRTQYEDQVDRIKV